MDKQKRPKWKKRLIVLGILAGVFVVLLVAAVEFTSRSTFCASCHYMKPYFKSWQESSHSQFECGVCHYPPGGLRSKLEKKIEGLVMVGRYWTKLYMKSKPWAEIKDESCLRQGCHDKRLLEGRVKFKSVVFDHRIHLTDLKRGKKLQCTSCHSQIVQGKHITVTEGSCFICHFKESEHYPKISDCSHCHTKDTLVSAAGRFNHTLVFDNGFACIKCHSHTIMGDGEVPRENCYKCHMEEERLEQYENTDMLHSKHITENKIECNQCHMDIQHKIIKDIETISDCRTCHTNIRKHGELTATKKSCASCHHTDTAKDCASCHSLQKTFYEGGQMESAVVPKDVMAEAEVGCRDCHTLEGKGVIRPEKSACINCHDEDYGEMFTEWQESIRGLEETLSENLKRAGKGRLSAADKQDLAKARSVLKKIRTDGSSGVHNFAFMEDTLTNLIDNIKSINTAKR